VVDLSDYDDKAIAACRSVMVEVLTILGKHREHLVIVGGWVPPLLFGAGDHIGSIDVDLAVDWRAVPNHVYETIRNELHAHKYYQRQDDPPNRFRRDVQRGSDTYTIRVDVITGRDADDAGPTHRVVQGIPVWCARGVEVALDHSVETALAGRLPEGGDNMVLIRVATAGALVVMKGIALHERMKEKDAYDIYYCCRAHPGGIEGLAAELRSMRGVPAVGEALQHLRERFATIESVGPVWAATVIREGGGDYEFARRDAFERVNALLIALA
jgi:Nucleotidyl transferase AbiEii toxin, Type IV TA system